MELKHVLYRLWKIVNINIITVAKTHFESNLTAIYSPAIQEILQLNLYTAVNCIEK